MSTWIDFFGVYIPIYPVATPLSRTLLGRLTAARHGLGVPPPPKSSAPPRQIPDYAEEYNFVFFSGDGGGVLRLLELLN